MIIATPARQTSTSTPPKPGDLVVVAIGNALGVGVSFRLIKSVVFDISAGSGVTVTVT
jgi:hypothetical protein